MAQNPAFLKTSWDKSEEWKSGEKHNQPAEVLGNFDDGSAARSHAELMRAATPEEEADLRIGLFFYGDEIEVSAASNSVLHKSHNSLSVLFVSGSGNSFP